ncbi:3032_t:CDS:2, partial [Paraglomus occultum]
PFEQDYPETIEQILSDGPAISVCFNRRGTLLAGGCSDGSCIIWDFDTKGVARRLHSHVSKVTSVSWSRNGRFLLTSGDDFKCQYWDLLKDTARPIRFHTGVVMAQMHPKNNNVFAAVLRHKPAVLVDVMKDECIELPSMLDEQYDGNGDVIEKDAINKLNPILCCAFDHRGERIFTGTGKGYFNIIDIQTRKIVFSQQITNIGIKQIKLSRNGKDILVNSNDRTIRLFSLDENGMPVSRHSFMDRVNRIQWNQCCFNRDGEYVIGGSAHKAGHNIYIWDKNLGSLVKMLEGPKDELVDLAWHPVRPVIASVSTQAQIYIWATNYQENWSAFAPDFKELEENIEYEEREDEFDIILEEEAKRQQEGEDIEVDVTTVDKPTLNSETEDEDEMFYIPTKLDPRTVIDEGEVEDPMDLRTTSNLDKPMRKGKVTKNDKGKNKQKKQSKHNRSGSDELPPNPKKKKQIKNKD